MSVQTQAYRYIRDLVRERSAIVLGDNKGYLVEARLLPLVRREKMDSIEELVDELRRQPSNGLHEEVVEAMTTNETSFFRDVHPFEALKRHVIPELIEKRADKQLLSIWCGACSYGQEPNSIAMLLRQHFPTLTGWNVKIIGTDLSTEVLTRARQGQYSKLEVNRGLPVTMLVKYFERQGLEWHIKDEIRKMIDYRVMNLIGDWPYLPAMDIIFLRNVLIYFDVETKKEILGKIRRVLKPDGYLFLGGAETPLNLDDAYQKVLVDKAVCYRLKG